MPNGIEKYGAAWWGRLFFVVVTACVLCSCRSTALVEDRAAVAVNSTGPSPSPVGPAPVGPAPIDPAPIDPGPVGEFASSVAAADHAARNVIRGNNAAGTFTGPTERRHGDWHAHENRPASFAGGTSDGYATSIAPPIDHFAPPVSTLPYLSTYHPAVGQDGHWSPPDIAKPWPRDEYICDGGDRAVQVKVAQDFQVGGLDIEDTVGHFDTLDGRTVVEATNCVCIYAPRFAAVRQVRGVLTHEGHRQSAVVDRPTQPLLEQERQLATTTLQQFQPEATLAAKRASTFRDRTRGLTVELPKAVTELNNSYLPYEDFRIIRLGQYDQTEKPRLVEWIDAAQVWEAEQAVQVLVDNEPAVVQRGIARPEETVGLKYKGRPKLCVVKVASTKHAHPGDVIDFTLRFDNRGDELIGNVTLIDNLTARLEYVEGSAQCSLDAKFFTQENEAESLVLRWEITDPIPAGKGGVIRFKCRVR